MPKFVIEREIAGAGKLTPTELQGISKRSCVILKSMGSDIQWVQSFVTENKIYCLYIAPNEEVIREHARRLEVPCNTVAQVRSLIDPTTAE